MIVTQTLAILFVGLLLVVLGPPDISWLTIAGAVLVLISAVATTKIRSGGRIEWDTRN